MAAGPGAAAGLADAVRIQRRLSAARKVVDRLTPALLAKAFLGELVRQDLNDEPARDRLAASELEPARFDAQLAGEREAGQLHPTWEDGEELWEALG